MNPIRKIKIAFVALVLSTSGRAQDKQFLTGEAGWPSVARVEHYSSALGMYGFEIHNYDGANMASVIHQYSGFAPAFQIDNTKNQAFIVLRNSENQVTSPGTRGSGAFMVFAGYGRSDPNKSTSLGYLGADLRFHSEDPKLPFSFDNGLSLAGEIKIDDRPAVSCKGPPSANYEVVSGIVVHC